MDLHVKRMAKDVKEGVQRETEWKKEHSAMRDNGHTTPTDEAEELDPSENTNSTIVVCTACGHKNVLVIRSASPTSSTSPPASRTVSGGDRRLMPPVIEVGGKTKPFGMYRWTETVADMAKREKHEGAASGPESKEDPPRIKQYYYPAFEMPKNSNSLKRSSALSKSVGELRARSRPEC